MSRRRCLGLVLTGLWVVCAGVGCIPDATPTIEATPPVAPLALLSPTPSPAPTSTPAPTATATPGRPRPIFSGATPAAFAGLSQPRYGAATAYVPTLDRWMLVGGQSDFMTITNAVDLLDAETGAITPLATLPVSLTEAAAVYAPTSGQVYVFGGSTSGIVAEGMRTAIYAIDPVNATVTPLATTLPYMAASQAAVYHPGVDRIYLFGGLCAGGILNTVWMFDPETETLAPANFYLPKAIQETVAVYSEATGKIYLFGGSLELFWTDAIYEVIFDSDGLNGSVRVLPVTLPQKTAELGAVVDPPTQLVYLAGGDDQERLWLFDPLTEEVWATQVALPPALRDPVVVFGASRRHLLVVGGGPDVNDIWRVLLESR